MTGNGNLPGRNAFSASRSSTIESLPPEKSSTGRSPLGGDLAHDVDRLGLELVEMRERERGTVVRTHAATSVATNPSSSSFARTSRSDSSGVRPSVSSRSSGVGRLLVGIGDAGELGDLAGVGLRVEALRIAARALLERGRDVDLDERGVLLDQRARACCRASS